MSSSIAFAVKPMTGTGTRPSFTSSWRMARVAVRPSITGICRSMRTMLKPAVLRKASKASAPLSTQVTVWPCCSNIAVMIA